MKVRVADSAGFCMGVRKAMDKVLEAGRGKDVTYTLGPLIHNPQALHMLEFRNIYSTDSVEEKLAGKTVVTRAHGTTVELREELDNVGAVVVDATCPKVLRSQFTIQKYYSMGYKIVIVGDRGHAEINALVSYTNGEAIVIETKEEAEALPSLKKVCIVAQTTFNDKLYLDIAKIIKPRAKEGQIVNTVCSSTERRQADVRLLARETDATVVVGGRNSANTCRLAEISTALGQPTFLVEDASELDLPELSRFHTVGVTAGASTPNWVIKQVVDTLTHYTPDSKRTFRERMTSLAYIAVEGNIVACASAAFLTYAMVLLMGFLPFAELSAMTFFYLFPLHTLNKYLEINWEQKISPDHATRMKRYWTVFLFLATGSALVSLVIAWIAGMWSFLTVALSYLFGGLYSKRIIPESWGLRIKSLRDIPASKDILIASAWTFAVVVLPQITFGHFAGIPAIAGGLFVFTLVLSRATLLAVGGMHSDKLVGIETIPVLIGKKNVMRLLYSANTFLAVFFIFFTLAGLLPLIAIFFTIPVIYMLFLTWRFDLRNRFFSLSRQAAIDSAFFITGIIAYISQ